MSLINSSTLEKSLSDSTSLVNRSSVALAAVRSPASRWYLAISGKLPKSLHVAFLGVEMVDRLVRPLKRHQRRGAIAQLELRLGDIGEGHHP